MTADRTSIVVCTWDIPFLLLFSSFFQVQSTIPFEVTNLIAIEASHLVLLEFSFVVNSILNASWCDIFSIIFVFAINFGWSCFFSSYRSCSSRDISFFLCLRFFLWSHHDWGSLSMIKLTKINSSILLHSFSSFPAMCFNSWNWFKTDLLSIIVNPKIDLLGISFFWHLETCIWLAVPPVCI